ncbi:uncharacterized protein NPIL_236611, partial [Nephila pilipes]
MLKIEEVDQSGAIIDQKWILMRKELQKTRRKLKIALHQLINMRKEQVAYRILLDKELGFDVDPNAIIPNIPGWT